MPSGREIGLWPKGLCSPGLFVCVHNILISSNFVDKLIRGNTPDFRRNRQRINTQFEAVEPANRNVFHNLVRKWEQCLVDVRACEERLAALEGPRQQTALGADLEQAWEHERATPELRKAVLRAALVEIVATVEKERVRLLLHWKGGDHSELEVARRRTGQHRWTTDAETVELVGELARSLSDASIAGLLNRLGRRTAKGNSWTKGRVRTFRNSRGAAGGGPQRGAAADSQRSPAGPAGLQGRAVADRRAGLGDGGGARGAGGPERVAVRPGPAGPGSRMRRGSGDHGAISGRLQRGPHRTWRAGRPGRGAPAVPAALPARMGGLQIRELAGPGWVSHSPLCCQASSEQATRWPCQPANSGVQPGIPYGRGWKTGGKASVDTRMESGSPCFSTM